MAEAVQRAFDDNRHLLVQAGTGTGKSLAYLVPALALDRPVVVAGTLALQSQIVGRDLRDCRRSAHARREPKFAILKGRSNCACRTGCTGVPDEQGELVHVAPRQGSAVKSGGAPPVRPGPKVAAIDFAAGDRAWAGLVRPRVPRREPMPSYRRTSPTGRGARQADVVFVTPLRIDALEAGTSCRARRGRG